MAKPTIKKLSETASQTKWQVDFPSTMSKLGATYIATTYPDCDLVFVQTAARLRKCNNERVKKLIQEMLKNMAQESGQPSETTTQPKK